MYSRQDVLISSVTVSSDRNNFHQDVFVSPVVENVTRGIEAGFHKSEQEEAVRIKRLLTECLYLAKKDHSLNSISDRIKTTAYLLDESLGSAYCNNDAARDFLSCLASVVHAEHIRDINASPVKTIILDESHDNADIPQLSICIRYLKTGRAVTRFYRMVELQKREVTHNGKKLMVNATTALSVAYALKEAFDRDGISMENVVFRATDGASTMLGTKSGLSHILQSWTNACSLQFHCVAHKHALAMNHAAQTPFAQWVEDIMKKILNFFAKSGQRRQNLKEIQAELQLDKLNMIRFHQVRWLSRASVLTRIVTNYPALRVMWEREAKGNDSVRELVQDVETHTFLGSLTGITDILYQQAEVNKEFQRDEVMFKRLMDVISHCISELENTYLDEGFMPGGHFHNGVRQAMKMTTRPIEEALKSCRAKQAETAKSIEKMAPATKAVSSASLTRAQEIARDTSERIGGKRAVSQVHTFRFSEYESKRQARNNGGGPRSVDRRSPPPAPVIIDGVKQYEVEKVVEEDEEESLVKVRWKGYSAHDDTWEPISAINSSFVDEFRQSQMIETRQGMQRRHVHDKPGHIYSYRGVDVLTREGDDEFVIDGLREYAREVVTGLKERFPSASAKVLSAFDIFSLETLPSDQGTWNQKRESYGDQDLSTLVNHYFPATAGIEDECKRTRVHAQWRTLRERMWEFKLKLTAEARNSTSNFWADFLNTPPPTPCEDVRELVEIFLVIALSSVPCERSYSAMNATKSKERSRMLTDLLNDLMTIKLNGPTIEGVGDDVVKDLIDEAFKEWHSRKKRCPARSHTDERPEKRKSEQDIMQLISMPRGEKISKTLNEEQLECESKQCQKNDSMSTKDD